MMSLACVITSFLVKPNKRSAALIIILGSVEIPKVNVEGTATRILPFESAPLKSISVVIGSSDNTP